MDTMDLKCDLVCNMCNSDYQKNNYGKSRFLFFSMGFDGMMKNGIEWHFMGCYPPRKTHGKMMVKWDLMGFTQRANV